MAEPGTRLRLHAWAVGALVAAFAGAVSGCAMQSPGSFAHANREDSHATSLAPKSAGDARMKKAIAQVAQGASADAEQDFLSLSKDFERQGDSERAAECLFWAGFCQERQGSATKAADTYRRVLSRYGQTRAAYQASLRLGLLGPTSTQSPADTLSRPGDPTSP